MNDHDDSILDSLPVDVQLEINRLCLEFEQAWRARQSPRVEDFAAHLHSDAQVGAYRELIAQEVDLRWAAGHSAEPAEYHRRFPRQPRAVNAAFALLNARRPSAAATPDTESLRADNPPDTDHNPRPAGPKHADSPLPQRLGRFEIKRRLGSGAFGDVYLAYDPQLTRQVALKVPRRERFSSPEDMGIFVQEARTAAGLTHPGIVTIYDVVDEGDSLFIVQEYVDGQDLGHYLQLVASDLPVEQAASLLMSIAEAVSFAHEKGFVHRDLKPANVLLDARQRPRVADFGLAVHESVQRRRKGDRSGTPAYMSPEQVRGETHRLDGRSDIWSLGVILYELLTGRRPFQGATRDELDDEIKHRDPTPPRQRRPQVPTELDRICLKCLSKRVTDRYSSALDLIEDLRHWSAPRSSKSQPRDSVKIVPKGLRSFDERDADFFLELLPGARDRDGLPESIRFWKTRIEERDTDRTFAVGLVYGPSGCGKSSLVKAGLLPRLASHVLPIYVEATAADTEVRLLKGLRKACPAIPAEASLPEVCESLREGIWMPTGRKVVLMLDQFEQWLHAHRAEQDTQLVAALRHCNGGRLQVIVMVRDDFWLAVSRFMDQLEVELLQGRNMALVDLFDVLHARKVLAVFGCAYGRLPDNVSHRTQEQDAFLDQAIAGLAQEGKVISVRLALFAEMVKAKPWVPTSLTEVGGTEGVGVTFLEESFTASTASPQHRLHQKAAQRVLKALLPEVGTDIKGNMRSQQELLDASGYADRQKEFGDLLRILDSEIRLITPTDPEGREKGEEGSEKGGGKFEKEYKTAAPSSFPLLTSYFQLTHDYLVPSLREWLTRKQRETRKGRAELKLAERAAAWNSLRESKQLPSLWEWVGIRSLTEPKKWTASQRLMMSTATRLHGVRSALVVAGLVALLSVGAVVRTRVAQQREETRMEGLVRSLVRAEPAQVPGIVQELDANPDVATRYLSPLISSDPKTIHEKRSQLHARLAMVARDRSQVDPLLEELLTNKVAYIGPIRLQLRPYAGELTEKLWAILRDETTEATRRFRAALALADYVPESESNLWTDQDLKFVTQQLVSENAEFQPLLRDALRPIRGKLLPDLERIFGDLKATDAQRLSAANAFADYFASDVARLSQLLAVATPQQYAVLYPLVAASPTPGTINDLSKIATTLPPDELGSVDRVAYGQRRANAAVTLLRLGEREKVLPVFELTDDPEALTQFIFRCRPRGVGVEELLELLQITTRSVSEGPSDRPSRPAIEASSLAHASGYDWSHARYALLLALGEFSLAEIPAARREALLKQLADWYGQDPSSGVHGAAGWLLRKWGQAEVATKIDQTPVPYSEDREWFTLAVEVTPTSGLPLDSLLGDPDKKTFYYTFTVFPPGEFTIGSVEDEPDHSPQEARERRHGVKLTRPFALLDREITMAELIAFSPQYAGYMQQFKAQPTDAGFAADWYDSVGFCRWLGQQSGLSESDQAYAAPESLDKEKYPREPDPSANWAPRDWPLELGRRGFRLPTEAEWEVASRAGARTAYGYGGEAGLLGHFSWFTENSGKHVHPPRELRPSSRGVFDLHGNLLEWTHDWYGDYGVGAITDPLGPQGGSSRVVRGGSWFDDAASCRAALRYTYDPTYRSGSYGFRLALSPSGVSGPAEQGQGKAAEPSDGGTEGAKKEEEGREK